MALTYTPEPALGSAAPDFRLPDVVSGKTYALRDFAQARALVVMFICNHCPYVVAVQGRIAALAKEYEPKGVRFVGICSNDADKYPEDSPEKLKAQAREQGFVFPYLFDENQDACRAYGAVATPDFFVYGAHEGGNFPLRYRGRLDDSWKEPAKVTRRDLAAALDLLLAGKLPPKDQTPSMGCSIKWKG
jgi:peroxiredoxin